jgi:glycosyltransferase involved in cell wall biosynthesis
LESMAMGIPVVAPAIPAFQDVIIDNHNGLFFDGFDSADLAVKMRFLIENPSQLSRLSTSCREYIESNHSYDVSGPKVIDFYQHVLSES